MMPRISSQRFQYLSTRLATNLPEIRKNSIQTSDFKDTDTDFKLIPFPTGCSFVVLEDQLGILSRLILKYIEEHAPFRRLLDLQLPE